MSASTESGKVSWKGILGLVVLCWLVLWAITMFFSWTGARATPQAGEIGVIREGPSKVWFPDWFVGHKIGGVVPPGAGGTYIGRGSTVHWYPADTSQRTYTITADTSRGDRPGVDVVYVQTKDGKLVGIQGTFFFNTNFNAGPVGKKSVESFDSQFGVRTFPVIGSDSGSGEQKQVHAYDGVVGWEAFLDANVRPIIDNDLRKSIGNVTCAQLVSSCALASSTVNTSTASSTVQSLAANQTNSQTIQNIQDQINASLEQDIQQTLGDDYFSEGARRGIRFLLAKVTLPGKIQTEIDDAQAAYAAVNTSAAKVQQAHQDYLANVQKELGYKACSACAEAAILSSIPPSVTTFAPGAGFAVTPTK